MIMPKMLFYYRPHLSFLVGYNKVATLSRTHRKRFLQAYSSDSVDSEPVGVIVCKQSMHKGLANRGYIAMLSVDRKWRKLGIG